MITQHSLNVHNQIAVSLKYKTVEFGIAIVLVNLLKMATKLLETKEELTCNSKREFEASAPQPEMFVTCDINPILNAYFYYITYNNDFMMLFT